MKDSSLCSVTLFFSAIFLASCSTPSQTEIIQTSFEKELIPEGIAVNEGKVYLSSLLKNKVAISNLDGTEASDFTYTEYHGFSMGLGMETYEDKLYVISSNSRTTPHQSELFVFNKNSGSFYYLNGIADDHGHFLNDLAISNKGEIFMTDSDNKTLYYKQNDDSDILPFLESDSIQYTNGIAISADDKLLYLATYQNGIQVVDKKTRKLLGSATQDSTISTFCIDGMKYYKNSLIGIQNGWQDKMKHRVMRYFLSEDQTKITHVDILIEANEYFDIPTTLDIEDDVLYFITNSQLENFDEPNQRVKNESELQPYYLMSYRLN